MLPYMCLICPLICLTGEMLYDMDFIAFDNTHLEQSPLLSTLRVGFEPCCIPLSVQVYTDMRCI